MNKKLHAKAIELRKKRKSYSEIKSLLNIPKSTLSDWFSGEKWSESIKIEINKKSSPRNIARINLMNKTRATQKIIRDTQYLKEADTQYMKLKNNPLFIAGLTIYWGEGEKYGNWRVSVVNTDVEMLRVVMRFYREILKVDEHKIRAGLFIYEDLNPTLVKKYWSQKLNLSSDQFIKPQILPSKIRPGKKRSEFGMCNIYVGGVELKLKIMRWIQLFILDYAK